MGPRLCPRVHRQSRANKLPPAAGNSCPPRERWRTRPFWPGPSPRFSQMGHSSPQPWVQTRLNPPSHTRQPTGACPATCTGLWATSRMAPLQAPTWTPTYKQESVLIRSTFLFQVSATPVPSWPGCGRLVLVVWRPNWRLRSWWLSLQPPTVSEPRPALYGPSTGGGCELPHLDAPGGPLCAASGEEPRQGYAWKRRPGGARVSGHSCPGGHAAAFRPSWPWPHQRPPSNPPLRWEWLRRRSEGSGGFYPKCHPRDDPRLPIPAGIQDDVRLKNRLRRQRQITSDPALKPRSTVCRGRWPADSMSATLESLDPEDQSLWRMTKWVMRVPTPSPPLLTPG